MRIVLRATGLVACFVILINAHLAAQTIGFQVNGTANQGGLGRSIANAGDVNGDGVDDVLTNFFDAVAARSTVEVLSGVDGAVLFSRFQSTPVINPPFGPPIVTTYGYSKCGLGDLNSDGFADFAVSLTNSILGQVKIHSGLNGVAIQTLSGQFNELFATVIGCIGDVNQDGHLDMAVLATSQTGVSRIDIYSPVDGLLLYSVQDLAFVFQFLRQIDGLSDVNGDGIADFIIGPTASQSGVSAGQAQVRSGFDGSLLYTLNGDSNGDGFGNSVAGSGDLDGDGIGDFVVGAPFADNNGTNSGMLRAFSGADGSVLFTAHGSAAGIMLGASVSGAGDINGDGFGDVVGGAPSGTTGEVLVYSGKDGSLIYSMAGGAAGDSYGNSVVAVGDANGDGFDDLAVGAPGVDVGAPNGGGVQAVHSETLPVLNYKTTSTHQHFLQQTWLPAGGVPQATLGAIACTGASPGGTGLVYGSLSPADSVLFGFLPVLVDDSVGQVVLLQSFGFDGSGVLFAAGISRQNPVLAGMHLYIQFFQASPLVLSSNGLRFLMVP